jgi:plasmid stabilization system protein ParE
VTRYRLVAEPQVDFDIAAAADWYENEQPGLSLKFLDELGFTYDRIAEGPLKYEHLKSGIRRALVRRFPYAVYFAVEDEGIIVLAVLHAARHPAEWQRRRV